MRENAGQNNSECGHLSRSAIRDEIALELNSTM